MVQEGKFQRSSDGSLSTLFEEDRQQDGDDKQLRDTFNTGQNVPWNLAGLRHLNYHNTNKRHDYTHYYCGNQRLEERSRTKLKETTPVFVGVRELMLIGFHESPVVIKRVLEVILQPFFVCVYPYLSENSWKKNAR